MSYPPYNPGYPGAPGYPPAGAMPQPQAAPSGLPYPPQPYAPNYQPGAYPAPGGHYGMPAGYPSTAGGMPQPNAFPQAGAGMPMPQSQPPFSAPYPNSAGSFSATGGYPNPTMPFPSDASAPASSGAMPYPSPASQPPAPSPYPAAQSSASSPYPAAQSSAPGSYPAHQPHPTPAHQPHSTSAPNSYPSAPPSSVPSTSQTSHKVVVQGSSSKSTDPDSTLYYTCAKTPGDTGTVTPLKSTFNPEADATQLRNCLKSVAINETLIVNILPHRSNAQRQKIRSFYKTLYGKDLLQDFRERLSGDFESVTAALLMTPAEYDAYLINKAIQGLGTDEDTLVEILCTRNNAQIKELSQTYQEIYKATIEQHMQTDSSGHFKRMLVSLANGARQEDQGVNQQKAEDDAKKLYKAGAGRLGTDESAFNSILVSQSFGQLKAVFEAYQRLYKKDMEKVIKSEMSGDLEMGMKAIVRFTVDKHGYFAHLLYKAMKGLGTNEKCLIRTLVSRSEIDLAQIKKSFSNIKGESKPLNHWIKKETSGPFRDMLLHILGDC